MSDQLESYDDDDDDDDHDGGDDDDDDDDGFNDGDEANRQIKVKVVMWCTLF